jgi:hypothetical protein
VHNSCIIDYWSLSALLHWLFQGLQISRKERVSPWDILEGHKNPTPLNLSWFGAVRLDRKPLKCEEQHRYIVIVMLNFPGYWNSNVKQTVANCRWSMAYVMFITDLLIAEMTSF